MQNYTTEHTPAELSAGGALPYISNHITYKPRKDLNQNMYKKELESIFVEIVYEKRKNLGVYTVNDLLSALGAYLIFIIFLHPL